MDGEQSEKNSGTDQMDPQLTTTETATAQNNNILSDEQLLAKKKKKEEKQRVKEEERREFWKKKRQMEKAKKKESRKRKIEELKEQGIDPTTQLKKRRRKNEITFDPQRIAIDCNFEELMSDKDTRKLANQLRNGYGSNMRLEHPLTLHFTSFKGKVEANVANNEGWEHWAVTRTAEPWWQVWPTESVVYLTAESECELEALEPQCVYVIGGLVDHNQHKGLTHRLALERGVRTMRLPIDKYLTLDSRKVLTVNQVLDILLSYHHCRDWARALEEVIPKRKGVHKKGESSDESGGEARDGNEARDQARDGGEHPERGPGSEHRAAAEYE